MCQTPSNGQTDMSDCPRTIRQMDKCQESNFEPQNVTPDENNLNDFPENQLTKFRVFYPGFYPAFKVL